MSGAQGIYVTVSNRNYHGRTITDEGSRHKDVNTRRSENGGLYIQQTKVHAQKWRQNGEFNEERRASLRGDEKEILDTETEDATTKVIGDNVRSSVGTAHLSHHRHVLRHSPNSSPMLWPLAQQKAVRRIRKNPRPEKTESESRHTKSEAEPTSENSTNANTEPEPNPENSWPEPGPEWPKAYEQWRDAWPSHTYGFAAVFTLIAVIPPLELFRIYSTQGKKTALKLSILLMIFIFSTTRAIALFVNPYGSRMTLPPLLTRLLFSIGHPCIIAALSLLLLVLIDTTKMDIAPPRFQRVAFIVPVVTVHVFLVVLSDIIVGYYSEAKVLLLFCQVYFLVTGLTLTVGYASVGRKISKNVMSNVNRNRDHKVNRLKHLIIAATVVSALLLGVTIYAAAGVFGIYSDVTNVAAWPWWILQTALRVLETAMCVVLLLVSINTSGSNQTGCFCVFMRRNWKRCCLGSAQVQPLDGSCTDNQVTIQYTTSK